MTYMINEASPAHCNLKQSSLGVYLSLLSIFLPYICLVIGTGNGVAYLKEFLD